MFSSLHPTPHEPKPNVQATHLFNAPCPQKPPRDDPLRSMFLGAQACIHPQSRCIGDKVISNPCTGSKCSRCFSLGSFQVQRIRTLMQVCKKKHICRFANTKTSQEYKWVYPMRFNRCGFKYMSFYD